MKSLIAFLQVVLEELGDRCHTSTIQDRKTVLARLEHEGLSFLTITLPAFGKDFQKSLDQGHVDRSSFQGFAFGKRGLPRFLGGFLDRVFDRTSGVLLDNPCVDSIFSIHQLTSMFGKIQLECSPERTSAAFEQFIKCEQTVRMADSSLPAGLLDEFATSAFILFRDTFTTVDKLVHDLEVLPKHGPGSTADRLSGNRKYDQLEWPSRLESVFPSWLYLIPNWKHSDVLDRVNYLEPGAERPVRVITVPKTLKTPRIIAIEPTCMQYMQQALLEPLVRELETDDTVKTFIGFTDQVPNQDLAREGSLSGSLATLDLSEASDRVSNQHVLALLARFPSLSAAVQATRSRKADVPGHGVVRLAKFASMGSALCFPMEAMVFTTIIFMALAREHNTPLTRNFIKRFRGKVRVYGDDIIVPVESVSRVIELLETFGLKVNSNKSFWTGKFRESCGGDFYDGTRITPVRVRRMFPTSRRQAEEVISMSALRNNLSEAGYVDSVAWLDARLTSLLGGVYPLISPDSSAIGRVTSGHVTIDKMCSSTHKPLVRAYCVEAKPRASELEGHGALMKYFLRRSELPFADRKHYQFAGRPVSVDIKTRWVSPI